METTRTVNRRQFLEATAAAVSTVSIVPAHVLAGQATTPPSDKLNIAAIGAGGRAANVIDGVRSENIIALADVDDRRAAPTFEKFPNAKRYRDFRQMLDELDNQIDAVIVGTPDHTHSVAVMNALGRGKHVYCEKPLAHSIHEVRMMAQAARQHNVITQLGNQGHSSDDIRRFCEWVWDGAIGNVTEIHAACDMFKELYCQIDKLPALAERHDVPAELDWDLWLGPASARPYHPAYVPFTWRGWMTFGTGCIGDWICHIVDPSMWALDLGAPSSVEAEVDEGYDPERHRDLYPAATRITFEFPAKGNRGPVKLVWHDGNARPPRPDLLRDGQQLPGTGAIVLGDKGAIMHGSHGAGGCVLLPESRAQEYPTPEEKIPRVKDHFTDWLDAIRNGRPATSNFDYGGPLTEIGLLGAIAVRFPTHKLQWDTASARFTNLDEANSYIRPEFRPGWTLS